MKKIVSSINPILKNIIILLSISIILKIAYLTLSVIIQPEENSYTIKSYENIIFRNDAGWYKDIAQKSYPEIREKKLIGYSYKEEFHQSSWAFFPMYPLTNKLLMILLHIDYKTAGLLSSLLFSFLSIIGLYYFCELYLKNSELSLYISLVFLLFPFHYYYSVMYTEAIFFTFLIFSFIAVLKKKYLLLSVLLIPLVLTRPNGIILLVPLYLFYLEQQGLLSTKKISLKKIFGLKNILRSLMFLTGPLAFAAFCYYQHSKTGYYFAFSIAQAGWYKSFMFPLLSLFRVGGFQSQFNSVYIIVVIVFTILIWKKNTWSFNILIVLSLLLPMCSGSVVSIQRYISIIFPLYIVLGTYLYKIKLKYLVLGLLFSMQLFMFYFWIIADPFSY